MPAIRISKQTDRVQNHSAESELCQLFVHNSSTGEYWKDGNTFHRLRRRQRETTGRKTKWDWQPKGLQKHDPKFPPGHVARSCQRQLLLKVLNLIKNAVNCPRFHCLQVSGVVGHLGGDQHVEFVHRLFHDGFVSKELR